MAKWRRQQIKHEYEEMVRTDPLAAGGRHRAELALEVDLELQQISTAIGEINVNRALVAASAT